MANRKASEARWNPILQLLHRIGTKVANTRGLPSCCIAVARPKGCIAPWVSHRCGPEIWPVQYARLQRRGGKAKEALDRLLLTEVSPCSV